MVALCITKFISFQRYIKYCQCPLLLLPFRNDITVLLSREDIFSSRENLSLYEEELDVNRLDYYQVSAAV